MTDPNFEPIPDRIEGNQELPPPPPSNSERTEAQQIAYLEERETNYVFIFGKPAAGKTAITGSLLNYLRSPDCEYGELLGIGNLEGKRLLDKIQKAFRDRRFPDRTTVGTLTEIEVEFSPHNKSKKNLAFTILDMSGEDLRKVEINENSSSQLPQNIDVFFKAKDLSMIFILVTSCVEASNDDTSMVNFLDYIIDKRRSFQNSRVLLLISQWDKFNGKIDINNFIVSRMPNTYARLRRDTNAVRNFSVGEVIKVDNNGKPEDYIAKYDSESGRESFPLAISIPNRKKIDFVG